MRQLLLGVQLGSGETGALLTTLFFFFFLGWIWWALRPANRARHEAAGLLPFEGEDDRPETRP